MSTTTLNIEDPRNKDIIENSPDWRSAVTDLLEFWTSESRCYSSGEVAAVLRQHRPDLAFSVLTLGSFIRDMFYADTLPQYADDGDGGGPVSPMQQSRFTVGKYRTPADTEVFVYGPNTDACDEHEFEVFVPQWNKTCGVMETMADAPAPAVSTPASQTAPGSATHNASQAAYGNKIVSGAPSRLKPSDYRVRIRKETEPRMYIGRPVFEAYCHMNGTAIRAGQPVYVKVEPGVKVTITLTDPGDGAVPRKLTASGGYLLSSSGDKANPFPMGESFPVKIDANAITVDLTV